MSLKTNPDQLLDIWVDQIFDKLTVAYGQEFLRRWQDIDIGKVKADWAHELAGYSSHPAAIAYVLANLPDRPPTVFEFRKIAMRAPDKVAPKLAAPMASRSKVMAELAKARAFMSGRMA